MSRVVISARVVILAVFTLAKGALAMDESWPSKPIEITVPYTAGSLSDRNARAIAPLLQKELGVPVIVQNVPGATGYNRVYRAQPDGYTLGTGDPVAQLGLQQIQPSSFDILKFTWLGHFSTGNQLLVLSAKSSFTSIDVLKNARMPVRCGTFDGISTGAMQCVLLARALNFSVAFVNVGGPSELVLAAVRGDVDLASLGPNLWGDHIKTGSIKPILIWSSERDLRVSEVPSLKELSLQQFAEITVIRGIFGPPGLPSDIRDRLLMALNTAVKTPEWSDFVTRGELDHDSYFSADYAKGLSRAETILKENAELVRQAF